MSCRNIVRWPKEIFEGLHSSLTWVVKNKQTKTNVKGIQIYNCNYFYNKVEVFPLKPSFYTCCLSPRCAKPSLHPQPQVAHLSCPSHTLPLHLHLQSLPVRKTPSSPEGKMALVASDHLWWVGEGEEAGITPRLMILHPIIGLSLVKLVLI